MVAVVIKSGIFYFKITKKGLAKIKIANKKKYTKVKNDNCHGGGRY